MTDFETQIEALASRINEIADDYVEYSTSHVDALDAYAHLPGEGDWDYHNNDERVAERARALGLQVPEGEEDALGAACLERITWRFDHMFRADSNDLGSFAIQEIEHQIELSTLGDFVADATPAERKVIFDELIERCTLDHFLNNPARQHDCIYVYSTTDIAAVYSLTDKALRDAHAEAFSS